MSSRKDFLRSSIIGAAGLSLLPAINTFAGEPVQQHNSSAGKFNASQNPMLNSFTF